MRRISENKLAVDIAKLEGKKVDLSIAQVKECLKIALDILANEYRPSEVLDLVERHNPEY